MATKKAAAKKAATKVASPRSKTPKAPVPKACPEPFVRNDDHFDEFAAVVRRQVAANKGRPIFTTDAQYLWDAYMDGFAKRNRQTHDCRACASFIGKYGALVTIDLDGTTTPLCWPADLSEIPREYQASVRMMAKLVKRAKVTGVFLSSESMWGTGPTPDFKRAVVWTHQHVDSPAVHKHALLTDGQAMAEKVEDFGMLSRAIEDFNPGAVEQAVVLLKSEALYRSEKVLGVAEWLSNIHLALRGAKYAKARHNLLWLYVATAPPGWCHVRTTMIGTLLEDIERGFSFPLVAERFAAKMHPLRYQRAQAAPSQGNIDAAEKIVAKLRSAGSLDRRFARLSDLRPIWVPRPARLRGGRATPTFGVVFGSLRDIAQGAASRLTVTDSITWTKFCRTVLRDADKIELLVTPDRTSYLAFVTAANPHSPPILQWDTTVDRIQVSWYLYHMGSYPSTWGLRAHEYVEVEAVVPGPQHWNDANASMSHHAQFAALILKDARDVDYVSGGGLFCENLRSEYHGIRKTLEAHFATAAIAGRGHPAACGLCLHENSRGWNHTLRVTAGRFVTTYKLDRWD